MLVAISIFRNIENMISNSFTSITKGINICCNIMQQVKTRLFPFMKIVKNISALKTISIEELRNFDGFADVSNEEAKHIIATIKELSLLTHTIVNNHEESQSISKLRKAE